MANPRTGATPGKLPTALRAEDNEHFESFAYVLAEGLDALQARAKEEERDQLPAFTRPLRAARRFLAEARRMLPEPADPDAADD